MKIKLEGQHKSLNSFESEILEKFTVITGKNGSGKSQLIELFTLKAHNNLSPLVKLSLTPSITKIQAEGIENSNLASLDNQNWKSQINLFINDFNRIGENTKKLEAIVLEADTWVSKLNKNSIKKIPSSLISESKLKDLIINSLKELEPAYFQNDANISFDQVLSLLAAEKYFSNNYKTALVAKFVSDYRSVPFHELSDSDFYLTPIPEYLLEEPKLFGSQLEYVFYNYAKRRDQNRRLFFEKNEDGDINNSISDSEFITHNPPPWDSINEILVSHNINFRFKGLDKKDFSSDASISFQLVKTTINKDINFQHLSSGEKVILGLIIKLFTSSYYDDKIELPELLVLDEPDAHLHPEMSKLLIDVLNETFVNKLGIYVIMVTHSPSTVALCPDNSIFQLHNEPVTSLKKIEKNDALDILTGHLPTLSIDYNNHKQVFVESPTDVKFYQTIFNKLYQDKNYPFRLYFISNSYGKSSCEQVMKIVKNIRASGNKTSYGIIDWDLKNLETDFIKVHGLNNRYNVENYIYDPVYLAILLMNYNAHNIYNELSLDETFNQYTVGNKSNDFIQKIIDWFFNKYYAKNYVKQELKNDLKKVSYLNGRIVRVPKWYLEFQGHDLEIRVKELFPMIERKFRSEGELQKELSLIIAKSYPFIPIDTKNVIESIINSY